MWNILSRQLALHFVGKGSPGHQRLIYLNWLEKATVMNPRELIKPFKDRRDKDILTVTYPGTAPWLIDIQNNTFNRLLHLPLCDKSISGRLVEIKRENKLRYHRTSGTIGSDYMCHTLITSAYMPTLPNF